MPEERSDVKRKIMPNKCEVCGIGIGKSMLFFENTWRPFKHYAEKVFYFEWDGGRVRVCQDCDEYLNKIDDANAHLKTLFNNRKKRNEEI
jgi:hypothetical protein